ncbi:MAG: sugar phosphate isomerase/epimerase [Planctomycetes bacterium]|nr:sugar phosphate isomerase/epimerase [Planctomycetota bacterium]
MMETIDGGKEPMKDDLSRREFMVRAAGAAAVLAGAEEEPRFPVIAFSKPFQKIGFDDTADLVADVGWDGIECPVRARGQIEPERVEEELPKLVEAMASRGRKVYTITTDIRGVTPLQEKVLRTAARLGIRKYRLAHWTYAKETPIPDQLREMRDRYRDLAALNRELGIQAGYQNHSGAAYIGAPVWDVWSVIREFDSRAIAIHFDIGHATLEGGLSWPIQARLVEPHLGAVYVKDFFWEKTRGWRPRWCPLGEGTVSKGFFENLKKSPYRGPISQHHEYFESGAGLREMVPAFKKDLAVLRAWLM